MSLLRFLYNVQQSSNLIVSTGKQTFHICTLGGDILAPRCCRWSPSSSSTSAFLLRSCSYSSQGSPLVRRKQHDSWTMAEVAADELRELEYLSLVSKVCTELDNHLGLGDKDLGANSAADSGVLEPQRLAKS